MTWRVLFAGVASAVLLTVFAGTQKVNAQNTDLWMNGFDAEILPSSDTVYDGNIRCTTAATSSEYVTNYSLSGSFMQFLSHTVVSAGRQYTNQCVVTTRDGLFATSGQWAPSGELNKVRPVIAHTYSFQPLMGGGFIVRDGSSPGGFYYSVNKKSLKDVGSLGIKSYGSGFARRDELTWNVDTAKIAEFYTYADKSLVKFDEMAVSNNGKYMVASIKQRGIVKIDLETGSLTPLANATFNNGVGLFMSISNDGRYAMVSKASSGRLMVYDTANCSVVYQANAWPRFDVLNGTGCVSKDIYADIRALYPDMTNLSGMHFNDIPAEVELFVYRPVTSPTQAQRVRLSARGYSSEVRGYLALGDSFASGEGDTRGGSWYEQGTDEQGNIDTFEGRNLCHLSRRSYPYLLALKAGYITTNTTTPPANGLFHSVACSGAVMHNVIGGSEFKLLAEPASEDKFRDSDNQYSHFFSGMLNSWQPGHVKQLDFLSSQNNAGYGPQDMKPEVITVSIGGNDAGFGDVVGACTAPGICPIAVPGSLAAETQAITIAQLKSRLTETYKTIKQTSPESRIYALGYPNFVQTGGNCAVNVRFHADELVAISEGIKYMNQVVRAAAQEAGVLYVDVEDVLDGYDLCSGAADSDMAFNGVTAGNDISAKVADWLSLGVCALRTGCIGKESFHPNSKGHELYAQRISLATADMTASMPEPEKSAYPLPNAAFYGQKARNTVEQLNVPGSSSPAKQVRYEPFIIQTQAGLTVVQEGYMAGSTVTIEVHSTPQVIGTAIASPTGEIEIPISLPANLPAGVHEVHLLGYDAFGNQTDTYQTIVVGQSVDDFDGDGVPNTADSCPTVTNAFVDADNDTVDDACDTEVTIPVPPQTEPETPEAEEQEEVIIPDGGNTPTEPEPKGQVSAETVAGNEQIAEGGTVLGTSTTAVTGVAATLVSTGVSGLMWLICGSSVISLAVLLSRRGDQAKYRIGRK